MSKQPWANRIVAHGEEAPDQLLANPLNWRVHPKAQQDALATILDKVGWVQDVIVNRSTATVIDGHLRVALAISRGEATVPVVYVDLDEAEEKIVLAGLDSLAHMAVTDGAQLTALLKDIANNDASLLELTQTVAAEMGVDIAPAVPDAPDAPIDRAAELQAKWQTARGQVWQVGRHRITCDDALAANADTKWVLFTDPPYGINYDPAWLDDVGTHRQALSSRDTLVGDDGMLDLSFLWAFPRRMVWGFPYIFDDKATGWVVWDKQPGVESRGIVTPIEMASTTMRRGFDMVRVMWGGYYRAAGEQRAPHPTQKPISVVAPFVEAWTKPDDIVYDPFLGSGTTAVAAEQLGRVCYGMEISPAYTAVVLERLSLMGLVPELVHE